MSEEVLTKRFRQIKQALLVLYGIVATLFVVVLFGDYSGYGFPGGWLTLWLLSTVVCISLGLFLLVGRMWKAVPLAERRAPAMEYLLGAFFNFLSLALLIVNFRYEPVFYCVPAAYAFVLFLIYARVYTIADRVREETFP